MGEAINLVENFKVEKVIFNCGEFNELELDLIKLLNKKKIPYYSCIKELKIDDNKLYFLNNKDYGNENDNSNVIYTELNNHKFLFMGDAGVEVEKDLIEKYNLQNIDVLKVGHHGSKTSSGKEFIDKISPKYSVISVSKNNIEIVAEQALHHLILEDIESFMKELGDSFSFIGSEYKIKIDDRNHYIDLLLFNIKYNCYVIVELKVTEFKVEYIAQVQKYMNYIDRNIKEVINNDTIGILICKRENKFVIEYCSDDRIVVREYELV